VLFALVKALRPKQWIKNLLVGAPLVFAQRLFDPESFLRTAAAFGLFCLVASSVYLVNDLVDVEADRKHPKKRLRPIASGELPPHVARLFVAIVTPLALGAAFVLAPAFSAALGAYFVLQIAYCFGTKKVPYLDVLSIAAGFVLRVLSGALVIDVPASEWLLACTALLAMFLGFGKRAHELGFARERATEQRTSLGGYSPTVLRWILHSLAVVTVVVYALYTQSEHVAQTFGDRPLIYTLPFPIIGILRFIHLVTTRHDAESPTEEMLKDPLFMASFVLFLAVALGVLYWPAH
jgi:4-hydroxybenzoate polyprenyltransferase